MARKKQKYYVVWSGRQPGIYTDWDECSRQVTGVVGAKYKSYDTVQLAEEAFRLGPEMAASLKANVDELGLTSIQPKGNVDPPVMNALAVDAACSGNPGVMEYQGVYVATRTQVFHFKAPKGTNNIGEFLAIVHGLSYLKKHNLDLILYSDSVNAINWVRQKVCKSKLAYDAETAPLWDYVRRAEAWLEHNTYTTEIRKWDTEHWGEIPADFGRK